MADREHCSGCIWSRDCKGLYEALGRAEGPSVVWKVMAAFLLPIFMFIACLVVLDTVLGGAVPVESARVFLGTLGSGLAAFLTALAAARFGRRRDRHLKETHDRHQG